MAVKEALKFLAAPLPVDLAKQALRQARRLYNRKTLEHGRLMRHKLPQEMLALRDVLLSHAAAHLGHLSEHFADSGERVC